MQVSRSTFLVPSARVVLGVAVGFVAFSLAPVNCELVLAHSVTDPVIAHVDGFGSFLFYSALAMSAGVLLSVCKGAAGCGCPISSRVMRMMVPSLALTKRLPTSALVADDMT